jgi:hypothetical protein
VGENTPLAERKSMVFLGTTTSSGRATAIVTATADATELGRIGRLVRDVETAPTPLEERLAVLGRTLARIVLVIGAVVAAAGILRGDPLWEMIEVGISLAVAAVPEGLPAVTTLILSVGVLRARRNALTMLPRFALVVVSTYLSVFANVFRPSSIPADDVEVALQEDEVRHLPRHVHRLLHRQTRVRRVHRRRVVHAVAARSACSTPGFGSSRNVTKPASVSSRSSAPTSTTPRVSVPVLSVRRTSMLPRFSMALRCGTSTSRRDIIAAPRARLTLRSPAAAPD